MTATASAPSHRRSAIALVVGIGALLLANYYLRHSLEDSHARIVSFLETFYPAQIDRIFARPWWRLLLPLPELTGSWAATTLLLIYKVERVLTPAGTWELVNGFAIIVAAGTSWIVFRSAILTITFAMCMAFGTQFYHAYAVTGGIASYLFVSYNLLLLMSATQLVRAATPRRLWQAAFVVSMALNVLAYEGWLDVLVLAWVATPFLFLSLRRMGDGAAARRLAWVTATMTATGVLYVAIKLSMGFEQSQGAEGDVVFNYRSVWPVLEDLVGNSVTHTYLAVSNFLPPSLVGATTQYRHGADYLLGTQHGYHADFQYLVIMNQVFYWRYFAGAAFVLVGLAFLRVSRDTWRHPSPDRLALWLFLLMLLLPASVHTMIKFRPMNAMPTMTYHVTLGIIGASLLLSWWARSALRAWPHRLAARAVVGLIWVMIIGSALTRPPYLTFMSAQAGLGNLLYPNPMKTLTEKLGGTYAGPAGQLAYQLMPYQRDDQIATARRMLAPLPNALPPVDQWQVAAVESTVAPATDGLQVFGDATQYGYQMMSPPIAVRPGVTHLVRVRYEVETGRVCAGILTGDQQRWVVPPDGATVEYRFEPAVDAIRVVIANCYIGDAGNPRSRFTVSGGSFAVIEGTAAR